jgi:hypothetical protein
MNAPRRRWYQFSLRTMFALVMLACVGFGWWVHWSKEWIRQRHEFLDEPIPYTGILMPNRPLAPWGLWLLGEEGFEAIQCEEPKVELAKRLFPEAIIVPLKYP